MDIDPTFVLTSVSPQAGIALVVAIMLTVLWRAFRIRYLQWVAASWWFLFAYTCAAAIAFRFSMRGVASPIWDAATIVAQASVILHAAVLVAGLRMMTANEAPRRCTIWCTVGGALAYAVLARWLPTAGPSGASLRELLRSALPTLGLAVTYAALIPGLWRTRRPGEYGTPLMAAALGLSAAFNLIQGGSALASSLKLPYAPGSAPWYPLTAVSLALFGLAWSGVLLEGEQRKRAEAAEQAARSDRMLRDALDASDDLIGVVDANERLVLYNARMARTILDVTGEAPEPLMPYPRPGRNAEERQRFLSTITRALRGERVSERAELFTTAGKRIVLDRRIVPVSEAGRVTGAFVVARDVTQDEALRNEAERAMRIEAMARMAGGLAHDFNNILTVVQTNLQLLAESSTPDAETNDILMETAAALDRANQLTRRLLGVARERPSAPARIDVDDLLRGFSRFLQHAIGDEVVLSLALSDAKALVVIDPGRLEQVLLNLALNARDAMPRGGTLRIAVWREYLTAESTGGRSLPSGPYVAVSVTDDGSGMDPDTLLRAGDPFFTTKPSTVGSGLGLATCRAIIAEAAGGLHLDSVPDHGTTVRLWLPDAGEVGTAD